MNSSILCAIILLSLPSSIVESRKLLEFAPNLSSLGTKFSDGNGNSSSNGTRWAVLVAGSRGFGNYRHQADVCHAYQILKSGGLKEENIIVFMYDDIAFNDENPRPGIIINKPYGSDVYNGVPKDYNGENVTAHNFLAVILGNKTALAGGSGKAVDSGPNDHIFIYYTDHGSPGMIGMPTGGALYANDLIDVLKKKHAAKAYKSMVFYLEACESGSIFDGLLPKNLNVYAMTASNPKESSWALYCPGHYPYPSPEYTTCLGDLFSVSWMEDSDKHDLQKETLEKQYEVVRRRTLVDYYDFSSHVMRYGNVTVMEKDSISTYIGTNPANHNFTFTKSSTLPSAVKAVSQRDADVSYLRHQFYKAPEGSNEKVEARKQLVDEIDHRKRADLNIKRIATSTFGDENGSQMLEFVRPAGHPLVDDWDCLKMLVKIYEEHCGPLSTYARKYARAMANMCNAGISEKEMITGSTQACFLQTPSSWSSLRMENNG